MTSKFSHKFSHKLAQKFGISMIAVLLASILLLSSILEYLKLFKNHITPGCFVRSAVSGT
jgi:hypothetical protein